MINVRIGSLFRFHFITEKNVKFYGKSISDFALFTFQKSHLALVPGFISNYIFTQEHGFPEGTFLEVPGSRMRVSFFTS